MFTKILEKVWGTFYLDCYDANKNLNVLHGEHINSFIKSLTVPVINFFKEEIKQTEVTIQLQLLLESWQQLTQIMSKVIYKNKEEYDECLIEFYYNIIIFKQAATKTIYKSMSGDDLDTTCENFYCHVLTDYMAVFMQETYSTYKLGTGIFSMQGFERRNKESKNCAKRFCNNRYNICISTMVRLFDLFFHSKGAY